MKKNKYQIVFKIAAFYLAAFAVNAAADPTAVEVIPIMVWQGQPVTQANISEVSALHASFPKLKIVHAINPRMLMNGSNQVAKVQAAFGSFLNEGDGIAMHISRLRDWMVFARLAPTTGKNLYGGIGDSCDELCGMDQSLSGIGKNDLATMVNTGVSEMERNGFGRPKIAVFEEGMVSETLWSTLAGEGFRFDWSGFNLELLSTRLKRFPMYAMNETARMSLGGLQGSNAFVEGRSLDHARFGIWLEGVDLQQVGEVTTAAIQLSKASGRAVKLPLFVNASTLIHHSALMRDGVTKIYEIADHSGIGVLPWSGEGNSGFDMKRLRDLSTTKELLSSLPEPAPEAVRKVAPAATVQKTEDHLKLKVETQLNIESKVSANGEEDAHRVEEYVEPVVFPSHAQVMSH